MDTYFQVEEPALPDDVKGLGWHNGKRRINYDVVARLLREDYEAMYGRMKKGTRREKGRMKRKRGRERGRMWR